MLKSNLTRKKEKCHCFIDFWQQRKPCKKLYVFLTKRTEKYLARNGLFQLNPIITPTNHATATTVRFHINYDDDTIFYMNAARKLEGNKMFTKLIFVFVTKYMYLCKLYFSHELIGNGPRKSV